MTRATSARGTLRAGVTRQPILFELSRYEVPIYEFECEGHGLFELSRPIAQMRDPAQCPECGEHGKRLLSAPNLATGSLASRRAAGINERSQHEPRVVRREAPKSNGEPVKRAVQSAHGGYPWAIGH